MRNTQAGVAALTIIGAIVIVLGVVAIVVAPDIMNYSEVGTLRKVGGGAAALGLFMVIAGLMKKQT